MKRREEGGRLIYPRGRLSLGREVGGTPGVGHWCSGARGHWCSGVWCPGVPVFWCSGVRVLQNFFCRETPCRLILKDTMVVDVKKHC